MSKNMLYPTPESLKTAIDEYFKNTPRAAWRIAGLAVHLDMSSKVLRDYQKREGYEDIVETAKTKIEDAYEERLMSSKQHPVASIFALKQLGWTDKTEQTIDINANVSLEKTLKSIDGEKF